MSAIFVSHSSRDTAFVDELRRRLVARGHRSVFIDYDPEFGIPVGREWEKEIYQRLRSCQGVIVVCSVSSMGSRWVFAEVTQGKALGKHIFPVRIDDCEIDAILTERQVLDLRAPTDGAFGRLWRALEAAGLDAASLFDWDGSRSPYPGMVPFHEADAPVFFGREEEIQHGIDLLNRLRRFNEAHLTVVLGASGSGKSSLVRAGLLPRLRRDAGTWLLVSPIRPRRDAVKETAIALAESFGEHRDRRGWRDIQRILHAAAERESGDQFFELLDDLRISAKRREATVLLVVDQAEELLTNGETESRRFLGLLRALLDVPDSAVLILCTLRSDYLGVFQQHPAVNGLAFVDLTVGPISRAGLVKVIEGPAEKAGLRLEPGLTEAMIDETQSANAMPLLAFSLRELYEHRDQKGALTIAAYQEKLGGLDGSVRAAAEAVFEASGLSAEQVVDLRDTFLGMVQINEQDRATSRPLRWADAPERIHPVIERLVQARLLIARDEGGERVLEVAHEALFSAWDRLRAWLDEDRERLRLRERLRRAATEWIEQDQNPGLLVHRGTRLAETEELLAMPRFRLTDAERAYLAACIAEREAAREAERRRADAARVAVATDWLTRDVSIAALVLTEVQRPDDTPFAVSRMNDAIARGLRPIRPTLFEHPSQVLSAFFSPKADWIVTVAQDHTVRIWPLGPRSRSTIQHHSDVLTTVFSPDGTRIITASRDCTAKIQAIDGSTEPLILHHKVPVNLAAFSPDGTHVVTGAEDGLTRVWRSDAPAKPIELGPPGSYKGGTEVNAVAFSPDGGRVLSASGPVVRIWPTGGAKEPLVLIGRHFGGYSERVSRAWFTPDGRHIVAVGSAVRIWPADGSRDPVEYRDLGSAGPFGVSADGRHFVLASSFDGEVWVFSIDRITKPARFPGEPAILSQVSPDGTKIAIVSPDNAVRVRASDGAGEPSVLRHEAAIRSVAFSHDSERVATVSEDGSARVWHADGTGEPLMLWHEGAVNAASFSPDGDTIVTASDDGTARRWWLNGDSLWRSVRGMMNDCLTPEFREMYLGESPDEAQRAHAACEQAHGRSPDATDIPLNNGYGD